MRISSLTSSPIMTSLTLQTHHSQILLSFLPLLVLMSLFLHMTYLHPPVLHLIIQLLNHLPHNPSFLFDVPLVLHNDPLFLETIILHSHQLALFPLQVFVIHSLIFYLMIIYHLPIVVLSFPLATLRNQPLKKKHHSMIVGLRPYRRRYLP